MGFTTKSWSSMTWMIWGIPILGKLHNIVCCIVFSIPFLSRYSLCISVPISCRVSEKNGVPLKTTPGLSQWKSSSWSSMTWSGSPCEEANSQLLCPKHTQLRCGVYTTDSNLYRTPPKINKTLFFLCALTLFTPFFCRVATRCHRRYRCNRNPIELTINHRFSIDFPWINGHSDNGLMESFFFGRQVQVLRLQETWLRGRRLVNFLVDFPCGANLDTPPINQPKRSPGEATMAANMVRWSWRDHLVMTFT